MNTEKIKLPEMKSDENNIKFQILSIDDNKEDVSFEIDFDETMLQHFTHEQIALDIQNTVNRMLREGIPTIK